VFGELVRVREQLVLLAAQPAAGLGRQDLQAALVELRAVTGLAAGLTAALAHDLGLRGAAVVVDRAAGTQVEVEAAAWLGRTLAADRGAVRAVLRRGRRLDVLAATRAALLAGTVTVEQADAIAVLRQVLPSEASDDAERVLLRAAVRGATPGDLAMLREQIRHRTDPDGSTDAEQKRYDARHLRLTEFGDGSIAVTGKLDPVAGAQVLAVLRSYAGKTGEADTRTGEQRMADALHHVCATHTEDPTAQRRRPEVIALVPLAALLGDRTAPLGRLADSTTLLSPLAAQALTCTGPVRRLVIDHHSTDHHSIDHQSTGPAGTTVDPHDVWDTWGAGLIGLLPARLAGPSTVLDYGRPRRLATTDQWGALLARDGGCTYPGCTYPGCTAPPSMTEVHHLREWTNDQGSTDLADLTLLCHHHHHDLHQRHQHLAPDPHGGMRITTDTTLAA